MDGAPIIVNSTQPHATINPARDQRAILRVIRLCALSVLILASSCSRLLSAGLLLPVGRTFRRFFAATQRERNCAGILTFGLAGLGVGDVEQIGEVAGVFFFVGQNLFDHLACGGVVVAEVSN